VIVKSPDGVYRSTWLDQFDWLRHGFGTRAHPPLDLPGLAFLKQVHSDIVLSVDGRRGCAGEGDAMLTQSPGAALGVKTADCLPILLADPEHRAVAAIHAGWRGTVKGIAAKTVAEMRRAFGSSPETLIAAIGPGIGACCFEVGPEVAREFRGLFPERMDLDRRVRIDLVEANRRQLVSAGVLEGHIDTGAPCTACAPDEFHSFRRDRERAGRMMSVAGVL
jgi:purine-nucleoside/S-methyl-5'-thioadenosine phosphorylase / adenosine deaminase